MRRAALERTNKARDVGSARNKRPRRSDHQMRHSGANNNRKCWGTLSPPAIHRRRRRILFVHPAAPPQQVTF